MENKTIFIGLGALAIGGYLALRYFKNKGTSSEEPTPNVPSTNQTAEQTTAQGLKFSNQQPIVQEKANVKPPTNLNTKAGGSTPVKAYQSNPTKAPFVNAKIMKDISKKILGQIVPLFKRGDVVSVANTFGESTETYLESNKSFKLKWDVDVYGPRIKQRVNTTQSGSAQAPQFDGGKNKGHNFPYFY